MKICVAETIHQPAVDIYRLVSDMAYLLPLIDPGVVSVVKQTEGPIRVGTVWMETVRAFGVTVKVKLELTSFDPGRSVDFAFNSGVMKGTGTTVCSANGGGTDLSVSIHCSPRGVGRMLYPGLRWDFARRERRRVANLRRMAESGRLDPSLAEAPPGM